MIGKKETRRLIEILERARAAATMTHASFREGEFFGPADTDQKFTQLVRDKTALYRASWIIDPLDEVITAMKKELEQKT